MRRWLPIDKGSRRTQTLVLFFVPTVFMISWAAVNYAENRIFTVSIAGNITLREYLATRAEEWGMAGHLPSNAAVHQNQNNLRERLQKLPDQERAQAYLFESMAIFKKYPVQIKTLLEDAKENAVGGWEYFPRQLPFSQQRLGTVLAGISNLEYWLRNVALLIIFFAPFIGLVATRVNPSPYVRQIVSMLFAMTLTFLYFLTLSGTTFWTGPRILIRLKF